MIADRTVLAVVPARGGSKGLPLKNLRRVGGRALVERVGDVIRALPEIDRAVVSTDHDEIARVSENAGVAAPFRRPAALSGDRIGDWEVLDHALRTMERIDDRRYDIVLMLQPTSPLRRPGDVRAVLEKLVAGDFDAVWSLTETDMKYHPLKQLVLDADEIQYFDSRGAIIIARQQLSAVYHRNGVAYALTRACILEQKTILGHRSSGVVLDGNHISIDTEDDIKHADAAFTEQNRLQ